MTIESKPILTGNQVTESTLIQSMIGDSVAQFFDTMISKPVKLIKATSAVTSGASEIITEFNKSEGSMVVAAVGFCGKINGVAYLYFPEALAEAVSAGFIGAEPDSDDVDDEVVNDVLGELANMSIGNYKNKLCDLGYDCQLTLPSIVRGNAFDIQTNVEVIKTTILFQTEDSFFVVDLNIKQPE